MSESDDVFKAVDGKALKFLGESVRGMRLEKIYGYRMALWAEQLGALEDCFKEPETLKCVKRVNEVAEDNWKRYKDENFTTLQGHLLKYPVQVDADGDVGPLPGHEEFPDVGGYVLGSPYPAVPDLLTT
ncbi:unnamed protein product [Ilex paraguariensis]|uniref:Phospholipase D C-terminal domain-containing protein n=1 Tax=Ilex paraguariensis TaxID=185542 RepID=A0ABC8RCX2_9AQUA